MWWMTFAWQGNSYKRSRPGLRQEGERSNFPRSALGSRGAVTSHPWANPAELALLSVRQIQVSLSQHKYVQIRLKSQVLITATA